MRTKVFLIALGLVTILNGFLFAAAARGSGSYTAGIDLYQIAVRELPGYITGSTDSFNNNMVIIDDKIFLLQTTAGNTNYVTLSSTDPVNISSLTVRQDANIDGTATIGVTNTSSFTSRGSGTIDGAVRIGGNQLNLGEFDLGGLSDLNAQLSIRRTSGYWINGSTGPTGIDVVNVDGFGLQLSGGSVYFDVHGDSTIWRGGAATDENATARTIMSINNLNGSVAFGTTEHRADLVVKSSGTPADVFKALSFSGDSEIAVKQHGTLGLFLYGDNNGGTRQFQFFPGGESYFLGNLGVGIAAPGHQFRSAGASLFDTSTTVKEQLTAQSLCFFGDDCRSEWDVTVSSEPVGDIAVGLSEVVMASYTKTMSGSPEILECGVNVVNTGGTGRSTVLRMYEDSGQISRISSRTVSGNSQGYFELEHVRTPVAGQHTYECKLQADGASGIEVGARWLIIE